MSLSVKDFAINIIFRTYMSCKIFIIFCLKNADTTMPQRNEFKGLAPVIIAAFAARGKMKVLLLLFTNRRSELFDRPVCEIIQPVQTGACAHKFSWQL